MMTILISLALGLPPQAPPCRGCEPVQAPPMRIYTPCGIPNCPCGCSQGFPCSCNSLEWECLSYGDAVAKGKPILIYFTTRNCPPCAQLSGVTFRNPAIVAASRKFTVIMADDATAKLFGVDRFPTVVIVHQGKMWRNIGYTDPGSLLRFFEGAVPSVMPLSQGATSAIRYVYPLQNVRSAVYQGASCGPKG